MKIRCAGLTTCGVAQEGHVVELGIIDHEGRELTLELSFAQAQAIAMTLPSLLTRALQALTGKASSRYVFALERWTVEQSNGCNGLLLTLATEGGFNVCFGVPAEACRGLGHILALGMDQSEGFDDQTHAGSLAGFN